MQEASLVLWIALLYVRSGANSSLHSTEVCLLPHLLTLLSSKSAYPCLNPGSVGIAITCPMKVDLVSLIIASIRESHVNTGDSSTKCDTLEKLQKIKVPTAVLDATIRRILFDLCDRHDECIDSLQRLLELVLDSSEQGLCASDLPLSMLEEIMDTQTISGCDKMFEFLERHRQRMTAKMGKGQTLLRLCNELLRRLSKTEDTVFCGRILIFLSLVFPLSERSAVNLRGEYNIDNVTTYEDFEVDAKATIVDTAAIDKAANEAPLDLVLLSNTIYTTFWSLQSYFNNPMQLLTAPVTLANFHSSLLVVVDAMESIERHIHKNESGNDIDTPQHIIHKSDTISEVRAYFTPKVLTSRKLLSLELADLSFRRHICIQILIVLDFLLGLTSASRETWDSVGLTINRSLQIAYVLPVADAEWVTQTRVKVSAVLGHGRSGARFLTLVESVLARDQDWLRWKCSGCASYVLPPIEDSRVLAAPSKVVSLTAAKRQYPHPVGNATLSKLWASAGGWSDAEIRDCPA